MFTLFNTLLTTVAVVQADTVVLYSGDRLEGEVVAEDQDTISLRRSFGTGNIRFVQSIRRADVERVERGPIAASGKAETTETQPAKEPRITAQPAVDKPALLRAAIARFKRKDYAGAGVDLTFLISRSTPEELAGFSDEVSNQLRISLAEMAGEAHLRGAMKTRTRPIRLVSVTDYEIPALIPKLSQVYEDAIAEEVRPVAERVSARRGGREEPAPAGLRDRAAPPVEENPPAGEGGDGAVPQSQPASAHSIAAWLERPAEYDAPRQEAIAMASHLHFTMSVLTERMRLDPQVKRDAQLLERLTAEKNRLATLQKTVAARTGVRVYTKPPTPLERQRRIQEFNAGRMVGGRSDRRGRGTGVDRESRTQQNTGVGQGQPAPQAGE